LLVNTTLMKAGTSLYETAPKFGSDLYIFGLISLNQGFLLTSIILPAMLVFALEHRFLKAAVWSLAASVLSFFGLMHAYTLVPSGVQNRFGWAAAPGFAGAYFGGAVLLLFL